jgi:urease accessory protein
MRRIGWMAFSLIVALVLLVSSPASAHTGNVSGGFGGGFAHPILGPDHVLAMVAVGLWGAFLGVPAIFILPIVFPLVMALGGVLGIVGVPLPGAEVAIAISAVVLGLMVALAVRLPIWTAAAVIGVFAIFHGYTHGAELPAGANAVAYCTGFVIATGLLHLSGIALALTARWRAGYIGVRGVGAAIACAGVAFLWQLA